jgi:hypothetical protein
MTGRDDTMHRRIPFATLLLVAAGARPAQAQVCNPLMQAEGQATQ